MQADDATRKSAARNLLVWRDFVIPAKAGIQFLARKVTCLANRND
jgi:hypothetical protein